MIKNYNEKMKYLCERDKVPCQQGFKAWYTKHANETEYNRKLDLDHILPQSQINRRKFPKFIDSILNLRAIDHDTHLYSRPAAVIDLPGARFLMTEREAARFEDILDNEYYYNKVHLIDNPDWQDVEGAVEEIFKLMQSYS